MNKKDINILKNNNINLDIALEYFTNIVTYNEMLRLWLLSSNKKIIRLIEAIDSNDNNLINEVKNNSPIIYRGFCDQLLNTDTMISYLNDNKDKFIKLRDKYNDLLDNEKLVINFLKDNEEFKTRFFEIGDGVAISRRRKKKDE